MVEKNYDAIVVGAGINGITCASYLQKSGLKTLVLEKRNECGPFALTEDIFGAGIPVDTHAGVCFLPMSPVWGDLELDRFGFDLIYATAPAGTVWEDKNIIWYAIPQKLADAMRRFSEKDAKTFLEISSRVMPDIPKILSECVFSPAEEEKEELLWDLSRYFGFTREDFKTMNAFEMLDLLYESEWIKTASFGAADIAVFGDPAEKGEGAVMLALSFTIMIGVPRGGMHTLPHSLVRCFKHHGGTLLLNAPVFKVEEKGGGGFRVFLSEDSPYPQKEFTADIVVLHTSPPISLEIAGELLRKGNPKLYKKMDDWDMTGHCAFTSYFLLKDRVKWRSESWNPDIARVPFPLRAYDSWEHAKLSVQKMKSEEVLGVIGDIAEIYNLSAVDPGRSKSGMHVLVFEMEYPINLRRYGGRKTWDNREFTDILHKGHIKLLSRFIEGFEENLLDSMYFTPVDNWRRNPSALWGHELGGDVSGPQWYTGRVPPRSGIPGLYFSNGIWPASLTHLGGGYVAASCVAEDLGVKGKQDWWKWKPYEYFLHKLPELKKV
jgi:phytoene dehydrogenase-like protein